MSDSETNQRPENGRPDSNRPENERPAEEQGRAEQEAAEQPTPQGESEAGHRRGREKREEDSEAAPEREVEALRAEVVGLKDQLLRALAEAENVRNRLRRERDEALRYATVPLIRDLLPVADNLRRALEAVPAGSLEADESLASLVAGVEMTEKALQDAFARHHIRRIDALGERLDPHRHEAMVELDDPGHPAGTVVAVYEVGYQLHDRLIRPARVAVAKGGPSRGTAGAEGPGGKSPDGGASNSDA